MPLKTLQGMIWEASYRNGDFHSRVYKDAVHHLRAWKDQSLALFLFSSGSLHAQKLLFGHSVFGDLTPLFSGYFDTTIGLKRVAAAYRHIAQAIGIPVGETLFLSDTRAELDAARAASFQTCWLVRDGAAPPAKLPHTPARDLTETGSAALITVRMLPEGGLSCTMSVSIHYR